MAKLLVTVLSLFIVVVAIILFDDGEKDMNGYVHVAQKVPSNVSYEWGTKSTIHFLSDGLNLQADLYLPKDVHNPVLIVGANGLGATRNTGWSKLIESVVKEGWAFMIFDYRNLGGSEGFPRHLIRVEDQQRDWINALKFASHNISGVNSGKIGAAGFSMGGGHLISIASKHDILKENDIPLSGIFLVAPFNDGFDFFVHNGIQNFGLPLLKTFIFAIQDSILSWFGKIRYVKYYSELPHASRFVTGSDWPKLKKMLEDDEKSGLWQNKLPARIIFNILVYRPIVNVDIEVPTFIMCGTKDEYVSPQSLKILHDKIPNSVLVERPTGHVGFLLEEEEFPTTRQQMKEFLHTHLK